MNKAEFLTEAKDKAKTDPLQVQIRDLLEAWGSSRRSHSAVARIEQDLRQNGLQTDPPFTSGWIGGEVRLVPLAIHESSNGKVASNEPPEMSTQEATLMVGSLPSANQGICSIQPQDTLLKAQSLMMQHDYSQLAVISGKRTVVGAITWESIAQARLRGQDSIDECTEKCEIVDYEAPLLPEIPRITSNGYVLVSRLKRVCGIVTTSDLSDEFSRLAKPFLLLGEIERRLRITVSATFTGLELQEFRDPQDKNRAIESASDLTFGEYVRLLEKPDNWNRLGWPADRKVFLSGLIQVRDVRNEVMHFSPDPLDSNQITHLENFIGWLRQLQTAKP